MILKGLSRSWNFQEKIQDFPGGVGILLYPNGYFTISNGIFKFNFLALVVSKIIGSVPNLH